MDTVKHVEVFPDTDLIYKICNGEKQLFEILIRRNNAALYKTGRAYGFDHEDTQDLMQDTFIDAYKGLSSFEGRSALSTWLIRIMLNNCYRKKSKMQLTTSDKENEPLTKEISDNNNPIMNRELSHIIEKCLQEIPLDYRMVFSLREMNGLKVAETAAILDISEANVKVRLNRAKAMLRKEISSFYSAEDIYEFNLVYCDKMVSRIMNMI